MDRLRDGLRRTLLRIRRFERREVTAFRRWIENTRNLLQLSVLLFLPLVLALVTALSNAVTVLPFLLFPPLASGAYTLFAQPESKYASPRRFVGGLTAGALCGWLSLVLVNRLWYEPSPETAAISPGAVAVGVFLTGVTTWVLDVEEPAAFAAALLVYVIDFTEASRSAYVLSVFVSSLFVAGVFYVWRHTFYERRARYLYQSTRGDDHVLVPMRTDGAEETAMLGARLAAAHDAGKVVLLALVDDEATSSEDGQEAADSPTPAQEDASGDQAEAGLDAVAATTAEHLEAKAATIEDSVGVPCEVVVATGSDAPARTVLQTVREVNCDLIATPYESQDGGLSSFVRELFRGDTDVLVHRSQDGRTRWREVMVPVRRSGDVAHAMLDFALRLVGPSGGVSVGTCIGPRGNRRRAERMLADLVGPFEGPIETRISRTSIESFLGNQARHYDLVIMGASQDRSAASRFVSPPTFERIQDLDCDVAIVDRNFR